MISVSEAISFISFSKEEKRTLLLLETIADQLLCEKFTGAPVGFNFNQPVIPKIAYAFQRKYEQEGNWRVSVKLEPNSCFFAFTPDFLSVVPIQKPKKLDEMPLIATSRQITNHVSNYKLLVRMPTRGRPLQALSVISEYYEKAGLPIKIEVIVDEDDESMLASEVLQRLSVLGCVITVGKHKSKIAACNSGRVSDWDILVLASDDMVPIADNYALKISNAMKEHFPCLDGAIYFNDGYQEGNICTLPIIGKRLYDQFGYVYHPSYTSLFCDTEQTELLLLMNRMVYVDEKIIEHRHHFYGRSKVDDLYKRNYAFWDIDKSLYVLRKKIVQPHAQFGFDSPPVWLSICIATLPSRHVQFEHLLDHIYSQISQYPRQVEVVVDSRETISIGEKRQALLKKAIGHFVSFVDDDDWVAYDYVSRIVEALKKDPDADCVSLSGVMTTSGKVPEKFNHSITNTEWCMKDEVHYRTPNHLNAVRRDLALKAGFPSKSHAEDFEYSTKLKPFLKNEISAGDAPLYYYFLWPGKESGK